jgi:hypothetical protein
MGNIRPVVSSIQYVLDLYSLLQVDTPIDSSVIHLNLIGTHLMIVNSVEVAHELFDKRSAIYSDRVRNATFDICCCLAVVNIRTL